MHSEEGKVAICIKIDDFCIEMMKFCIKNDEFNANFQDVVIEVDLPALLVDLCPAEQACLKLTLSYWDVAAAQTRVVNHTVVIKRERDVATEPRVEVEAQRQRVMVSQAM